MVLVFLPKVFALVLAIPDPVFAAYFIVGAAFLVGLSLQYELIYPEFVSQFAGGLFRSGWDAAMAGRLDAVGEEALLTLIKQEAPGDRKGSNLRLVAFREESGAVLEFVVAPRGENIQDRLATLPDDADETSIEQEVSLRLLRHLASSVRHQQYHDTDIVTVRVEATATADPAG